MKLPDTLTPEQSAAIVACLRILARHGQYLRERAAMQSCAATAPTDERATAQKNERGCQVPIRRADGKVIGKICGETFRKVVRASKHFLHTPCLAIANDLDVLASAKDAGARVCEIVDRESKHTYRATIEKIWQRGFHVDRNHGAQIALALSEWNRDGEPTADQQKLF
jgi:hypothetical protein